MSKVTESAHEAYPQPRLVGDISGMFYVPAYQRGYRWGEPEVRRLLEDIWESRDRPYYLQPVVVKGYGDEWELVDGQRGLHAQGSPRCPAASRTAGSSRRRNSAGPLASCT